LIQRFPRNFFLPFEVLQMYSDRGDKNSALVEIGHIRDLRQIGAPGFAELAPEKSTISRATFFSGTVISTRPSLI
jgi:hypothetical protein